jgi:hypothetical protein
MAQINPRTFADAIQLADNVYELILTNWGNRGLAQDPNNGSISYPPVESQSNGSIPIIGTFKLPLIPSLTAIAIAPRSTVDRCVINYTTLPQTPMSDKIPDGFVNNGKMLETEQLLSIHAPLIGQQPGPILIRAHETSYFSDSYVPVGNIVTATKPFGTALPLTIGGSPIWTNPELRLLLYLNGKAALPPHRRAPFHFASPGYTFTTANTEDLLAVVPFAGRRYARVNFKCGAGDIVLNLTGVQWNGQPAGPPTWVLKRNFEYPLAGPINLVGPESTSQIIENPGVSFLLVKATNTNLLDTVRFTIDLFD